MAAAEVSSQRLGGSKPRTAYSALQQSGQAPRSPHTSLLSRSLSSQFGSPGPQRIEDEDIVFDIGSRFFRVGIAGEASPKSVCRYGHDFTRRAGDYEDWQALPNLDVWSDWELWDYELLELDLGLVQDKLERALRVSLDKNLVLDIRTRSAVIALPPSLPNPLIELVLKTVFTASNHPKSVYLMSSPILCAVSAGLRSALVVDLGWHETNVTAVYEYREVSQMRSVRAGKRSAHELERLLSALPELAGRSQRLPSAAIDHILMSLVWCRNSDHETADEVAQRGSSIKVVLGSNQTIPVNFGTLAKALDPLIGKATDEPNMFDHHDLPVPLLMWKALLALPTDIRAICMSRIVFTGGCSNIPGIKRRLMKELEKLVETLKWDPISLGRHERENLRQGSGGARTKLAGDQSEDGQLPQAREHDPLAMDEISRKLERESLRSRPPAIQGQLRTVRTLGAWAGASMMSHLRVEGSVEIKAEDFLRHGMSHLGYPIH